ncbi:glycosyl transferase [Aureimonas endophytica]|uniref:Glycosyl transferase n=1 Tax=Aureimonas endophytica TaxID=2027858 RepID=A0A916ZKU4_9HYPH|nr:glycosyltransferase [Aureimonas endophytica]GGE01123.1 glycosyl transferase [Aureimonas endophytica]
MTRRSDRPIRLAVYLPDLSGGGAERLHVRLAPYLLDQGFEVTLLLDRARGELMEAVPAGCRIVALGADRQIKALPKLVSFLKRGRPDVLLANMEHMNVMAVLARRLAKVPTRIVATQHNAFSEQVKRPSWQWRALPRVYRLAMPHVAGLVAVSAGVADDLTAATGLDRNRMTVIHNGVVTEDFAERAGARPEHPWFAEARPVVLGVGRLVAQKDFATLVAAFAKVAAATDARLVIHGEGPLRGALEAQIAALGLGERVALPGFTANPLAALAHARLFALSSRFEGFGNVVAEALACGTPVVSTDCPHGPAEILEAGRHGRLVPVGDAEALGAALSEALREPRDPAPLRARGNAFTVAHCAAQYADLFRTVLEASERKAGRDG